MKNKAMFVILLLFVSITLNAQNKSDWKKNELKIGVEMPVAGGTKIFRTHSNISQGFSVRYLRNVWNNLSVGAVVGANYQNQISDMDDFGDFSVFTYSSKHHYAHLMLHYKLVNSEKVIFALHGSVGFGYSDIVQEQFYAYDSENTYSYLFVNWGGKELHYLLGAETAYRITPNFSINLDYKYDHKNSNHLIGVGLGYAF